MVKLINFIVLCICLCSLNTELIAKILVEGCFLDSITVHNMSLLSHSYCSTVAQYHLLSGYSHSTHIFMQLNGKCVFTHPMVQNKSSIAQTILHVKC